MLIAPFVQLLRAAGVLINPVRVSLAAQALLAVGFDNRTTVRAALAATLLERADSLMLFNAAFDVFWRAPDATLNELLDRLLPAHGRVPPARTVPRRLLDAIRPPHSVGANAPDGPDTELRTGASAQEALRERRFDELGADEWRLLRQAVRELAARLQRPVRPPRRRWQPAPQAACGRLDWRRSLRAMAQQRPHWAMQCSRPPQHQRHLVIDASGSMAASTRALLLLAHALLHTPGPRWRVWVFATRLTPITAVLRALTDADAALRAAAAAVADWGGGTRLADCLSALQRLGRGSQRLTLLVTDALDGAELQAAEPEQGDRLLKAAQGLNAGASRLLWLDPLTRDWDQVQSPAVQSLLNAGVRRVTLQRWADVGALLDAVR